MRRWRRSMPRAAPSPSSEFFSAGSADRSIWETHPAGVAVSPSAPPVNGSRDVYVEFARRPLPRQRNLFGTNTTSVPYPRIRGHEGQSLDRSDRFGPTFWVHLRPPALFSYDGSSETIQVHLARHLLGEGLEYLSYSPFFSAFLSIVIDTCPASLQRRGFVPRDLADYAVGAISPVRVRSPRRRRACCPSRST